MKASSKRILSILIAILILVASLFVYSSFIKPAYSEIKDLRSEVASRLNLIAENESSLEQIQKLLGEYQNVAQLKETISLIFPTEQDLPQVVNQITSLANINKLTIDQLAAGQLAIKPSTHSTSIKGKGTLRFSFHLNGSYENFKSFLQNLETNMSLMDLVNLKIEPSAKTKAGENNFSYNMTIDRYYQSE